MISEELIQHVEQLKSQFVDLEKQLSDPEVYSKQQKLKELSREHQRLTALFKLYDRWCEVREQLAENRQLLTEEADEELASLIQTDLEDLELEFQELADKLKLFLLPPDPNESRNTIVEIRPAAGGDESGLFAGDLYRMYTHYSESHSWKLELLDYNGSDLGGIKEVVFSLSGDDVFAKMKYESGVHRVQRVPTTESGGRIHTSTVTVSVLPEAEEVEIEVRNEDLRFDVFRASGPGGQCVNTTDSAVRITHIPSGLSVASQQEKSQHRNKEIAMRILRARLLEMQQAEEAAKHAESKRAQIGTGDRSERIRTYNFPQNRVTDHRFGVSSHDLPKIMNGDLDILFEPIINVDNERRLKEFSAKTENK